MSLWNSERCTEPVAVILKHPHQGRFLVLGNCDPELLKRAHLELYTWNGDASFGGNIGGDSITVSEMRPEEGSGVWNLQDYPIAIRQVTRLV